jgi:hypothetical protein
MANAAAAGNLYVIERDTRATALRKAAIALTPIPAIEGKPNTGFSYGTGFEVPSRGVSSAQSRFEAGGSVTPHWTRNLYVVNVIRGPRRLELFDDADQVRELRFKAGDVIVLPPATTHRWVNGSERFDFIGVECAEPAKA